MTYSLRVNGEDHIVSDSWIGESLLFVLRGRLGLPGSKNACEQGECGSCSVVVDDKLVCSCLMLAASCIGREIKTVEAIANNGRDGTESLTDIQQAFVQAGAVQCGFCTPGFVVAINHLLNENPRPTELEVREAMSGNLCRCTGYGRILDAVAQVVTERTR